jgi:hypothetical protein
MSDGYEGWKNYETWAVKLWMDNEEPSYHSWQSEAAGTWEDVEATEYLTRSQAARFALADSLKEHHEHNAPKLDGPYSDLLSAALSDVDWFEIADALLTDAELDGYEARA